MIRKNISQRRFLNTLFILFFWLATGTMASAQAGSQEFSLTKKSRNDSRQIHILIAYRSKYGSTAQYAQWIQQEAKGDLVNIETVNKPELAGYDIIIIGGYIRAGHIVVAPFIKNHWGILKEKSVILFTTSGTPPQHPRIQKIYEKDLPEQMRNAIKYFPLHGRICGKDLSAFDRFLISVGKIMETDESLKRKMGKDFDSVHRDNLTPLLQYIGDTQTHLTGIKATETEAPE
jgi:menaquinone-dependent protoporphyrinogen IX oxidase